jgi:predicted nucleotide-binding protein
MMRVLLVEDDRYYAQLISESLQDYGFLVDIADSVEHALAYQLDAFAVIIIDIMLPNDPALSKISIEEVRAGYFSGVALARRIRQLVPSAKILLMTSGDDYAAGQWADAQSIAFVRKSDGEEALFSMLKRMRVLPNHPTPRAFIVHGRDEKTLSEVKEYLQTELQWQRPVVLREEASSGKTIIEKFEQFAARVDCVFVLLTPDDDLIDTTNNELKRRSRQNVIFELGFFYAQFGRQSGRVLLLYRGVVEIPSDLQGIVWIDISNGVYSADALIKAEVGRFSVVTP